MGEARSRVQRPVGLEAATVDYGTCSPKPTVLWLIPPLTVETWPPAVLLPPPLTLAKLPLAVLGPPPLTLAAKPLAVLIWPPLTLADILPIVFLRPATNPPTLENSWKGPTMRLLEPVRGTGEGSCSL